MSLIAASKSATQRRKVFNHDMEYKPHILVYIIQVLVHINPTSGLAFSRPNRWFPVFSYPFKELVSPLHKSRTPLPSSKVAQPSSLSFDFELQDTLKRRLCTVGCRPPMPEFESYLKKTFKKVCCFFSFPYLCAGDSYGASPKCSRWVRLTVRTHASHACNTGSIPVLTTPD